MVSNLPEELAAKATYRLKNW